MNIIIYEIIFYGDPIARMYIIFFWPRFFSGLQSTHAQAGQILILGMIFDYGMRKVFGNGEC